MMKLIYYNSLEYSLGQNKKTYVFSDEHLMRRFQNGDENAYETLVSRYKDKLHNFIYFFVGDKDLAEDLVQDTMVRLFTKRHYYKEVAKFSTWIYTISRNLSNSELRKRKKRKTFTISELSRDKSNYDLKDEKPGIEQNLELKYEIEQIKITINKLSRPFRTVLILRDIENLSYDNISKIEGVPVGTIKSRINRARLQLRRELKDLF